MPSAQLPQERPRRPRTPFAIRIGVYSLFSASVFLALVPSNDSAWAKAPGKGTDDSACAQFDHQHASWNTLLKSYVRKGVVNYAGLKQAGGPALDGYLRSLESVCPGDYDKWTREQKLAFWINAYNAYTVKLVLTHYPIKSIRSIGFLPGAAFRESFIPLKALRGEVLSLNDIEHEILRKEFREPRIHFAINCASKSCPALQSEVYRSATLDTQLTLATRQFVSDTSKNRFDAASSTLYLSAIFDWFREDFERSSRTLPAFVARYAEPAIAAALSDGEKVRVKFLDYDWALNGR